MVKKSGFKKSKNPFYLKTACMDFLEGHQTICFDKSWAEAREREAGAARADPSFPHTWNPVGASAAPLPPSEEPTNPGGVQSVPSFIEIVFFAYSLAFL